MTAQFDPITALDRVTASVLMRLTPEHAEIQQAQRRSKEPLEAHPGPFAMEPDFVVVTGKRLRYARGGTEGKPIVLLLSPLPQSILCFDQIWPFMVDRFELVALDLPGFGRSEGGAEVMTAEAQSEILDAFVRQMDLIDFHLVGPDVGTPVALHYAIHREHRARSLLVGDGPCVTPSVNGSIIDRAVNSRFWRTLFRFGGAGSFVEGANRLAYVNYTPSRDEVADYVASYRGRIGAVMEWFRAYPQIIASIEPHLAKIDLPVQIFWGELDQLLLVKTAHSLHERLKRSRLEIFENCGHFSYQDKPEDFAAMIADWVETGYTQA
jgi:pimeloyl-ACP methyl ester carboxylesterase